MRCHEPYKTARVGIAGPSCPRGFLEQLRGKLGRRMRGRLRSIRTAIVTKRRSGTGGIYDPSTGD